MEYELDLDDTTKVILERLPKRQKECFILHYAYGYKYKEIAGMLGISVNTVSFHLKTARVNLPKTA